MSELIECARCGKFFRPAWTEEEARAEYAQNFGMAIASEDEGIIICDDCYNEIDPKKFPDKVQATKDEFMNKKLN